MNEPRPAGIAPTRVPWVDVARGYGILLVIYGHFVERLAGLGYQAAFLQFKFIYAFHVPLFFWLAGYIHGDSPASRPGFLRQRIASRLVPALFFNLIAFPLFVLQDVLVKGGPQPRLYAYSLLSFLRGYPSYNFVMWFVICLFTVECLHVLLTRWTRTTPGLALAALAAYGVGIAVLSQISFVVKVTGIALNFWFVHEALIALSFYLLGRLVRRLGAGRAGASPWQWAVLAAVALAGTLVSFNLNAGAFKPETPVVLMAESFHGNPALFPLTALTGIAAAVALARLIRPFRSLRFLGENTLILLGLNGLFHTFINPPLAQWMGRFLPDAPLAVLLAACTATLLAVAVCMPFILALNRFVPQLVGKPRAKGPWLPNLI